MPLKYKNMAEKQDIAMNQFQVVSDAPYIYVELADGSQGKIKKSDLVEVIRLAMPIVTQINKGLMPPNAIIYKGMLGANDLKDVDSSFGYAYGTKDGSNTVGPYLSLNVADGYMFQLKVSVTADSLKFRAYHKDTDTWSSWKSISFT
mgnify:CR=1 FL=1|jgi:hypothetical protein